MILLPLLLAAAAQHSDHSTDRLPPANPLPIGEDAPATVLEPLRAVLAAPDTATVASLTIGDAGATILTEDGPGTADGPVLVRMPLAALHGGNGVEERLTNPAVEVDGDVAMVWSPYVDIAGTRLHGCGVVHASMVRESGRWRVLTLLRSVRHSGCEQLMAGAIRP